MSKLKLATRNSAAVATRWVPNCPRCRAAYVREQSNVHSSLRWFVCRACGLVWHLASGR